MKNITVSPSPIDTKPRIFQAGCIVNNETFERIKATVYGAARSTVRNSNEQSDGDNDISIESDTSNSSDTDDEVIIEKSITRVRAQEMQQLTQSIQHNQPKDDIIASIILQQLNDALQSKTLTDGTNVTVEESPISPSSPPTATTTTITTAATPSAISSMSLPYPPTNQTGPIADHDRPYADYGHLDRSTIAQECDFHLERISSSSHEQPIRLHAKSFAITSWTNVSKELVMEKIKQEFDIRNIQYICIGEELSEMNHQPHLHIQIIFKEKIDRKKTIS